MSILMISILSVLALWNVAITSFMLWFFFKEYGLNSKIYQAFCLDYAEFKDIVIKDMEAKNKAQVSGLKVVTANTVSSKEFVKRGSR